MATKLCAQCNALHQDAGPFCSVECYHTYVGAEEGWGPEDGGCCPCGGVSCDGTCDSNSESAYDYENEWSSGPVYTCLTAEEQAFEGLISALLSDVTPFIEEEIPF